jgi:tRNA pseudouridine13 synthase
MHLQLKKYPSDFHVVESMVLPYENPDTAQFHYLLLTKCNHSTFYAVKIIAKFFHINDEDVTYAGLKDEDGITMQFICLPIKINFQEISEFNKIHFNHQTDYINIKSFSSGNEKIKIGGLSGNNFRIKVRGLTAHVAQYIFKLKTYSEFFINYYGPQRFGLPNQKKSTHVIGEHLLKSSYSEALALIAEQNSDLGKKAKSWHLDAKMFFEIIEPRQLAFFKNSHYSWLWNQKILSFIQEKFSDLHAEILENDCFYLYPKSKESYIEILSKYHQENYAKVLETDAGFKHYEATRQVVYQTTLFCHGIFECDQNLSEWCADVSFFLPSGCYATIALPQIFYKLQNELLSQHPQALGTINNDI